MLEGVIIVLYVIIVIVWISEKEIFNGKNIGGRYVELRQEYIFGFSDDKGLIAIESKIFPKFKSQVGVGISVTYYFKGFFNSNGTVVSGDDDLGIVS